MSPVTMVLCERHAYTTSSDSEWMARALFDEGKKTTW